MHIDDTALREAMLRLLNGWRIQHGIEITRAQLQTQWYRTGLRQPDFVAAIALMQRVGALQPTERGAFLLCGTVLDLLSLPPDSVEELATLVIARADLYRAMQRRRSPHPGHDRRREDQRALQMPAGEVVLH